MKLHKLKNDGVFWVMLLIIQQLADLNQQIRLVRKVALSIYIAPSHHNGISLRNWRNLLANESRSQFVDLAKENDNAVLSPV